MLAAPSAYAQVPAPTVQRAASNQPPGWSNAPTIHPAVVRVVAPGQGSISYGSGTLVHVNDQYGLVLTNWHVINEATGPISVHFADGFAIGTWPRSPSKSPTCKACPWQIKRRGPAKY